MDEGKISGRYARALYDLAEEQGSHHQIYAEMETLSQAFLQFPNLTRTLSNPMHTQYEKRNLLEAAAGVKVTPLLKEFFRFVIEKGREAYMVFISMSYQKLYREKQRIVRGKITSAVHLKEETIDKIKRLINKDFHSIIELSTEINPDIIGGFIFEVNNYLMDSSIKNRLKQIQNEWTNA